MKNKLYVSIIIIILMLLSITALNTVSSVNYDFLNLKHKHVVNINFKNEKITLQIADRVYVFKNFFSDK